MINIVILSQADFAGSAYQAACAINSVKKFNVRCVSMSKHPFDFPHDIIIPCHQDSHKGTFAKECENYEEVMQLLNDADLIHLWNDIDQDPKYMDFEKGGINIPLGKPIVVTMTGSLYRNEHVRLNTIIKERGYKLVVQNPMLRFLDEIESVFIPHAVDTEFLQPLQRNNEKITLGVYFGHYYATVGEDRNFLMSCIKDKNINVIDHLSRKILWKEHIEFIKNCDILYHGIKISEIVKYIGRSSLEAMAMGIPVITFVNEQKAIELSEGKIGSYIPIYNTKLEQLKNHLDELIKNLDLRIGLGIDGRKWVERHFSYKTVGEQYSKIYEEVLNGIV